MLNNELKVDFYVSFPMIGVKDLSDTYKPKTDMLKVLENRTRHELCVWAEGNDTGNSVFDRIKRSNLDILKLKIFKKDEEKDFKEYTAELYSSVDVRTNMTVLTLYAIDVMIEISTLADCITRSEVLVSKDGANYENIYSFVSKEYGLIKKGSPKLFATIHDDPEAVDQGLIASILFGEQYFGKDSPYGEIIDKEILGKLGEEYGIAQYSYAKAYVNKNVFLQISSGFPADIAELLYLEGMSLFYIEMLLFEEAAIVINNDKITNFLLTVKNHSIGKRLKQIYEINAEYARTLEFKEMLLNYPTSNSSMKNIRNAFGTEELSERLSKNKSILQNIFDAQRDIANTRESTILNVLALIITLLTIGDFLTQENFSIMRLLAIAVIVILYLFSKRLNFIYIGKKGKTVRSTI